MTFLGFPIEIWLAVFLAVMIKIRNAENLNVIGYITTIAISLISGVLLYMPVVELLSLSPSWHIPIAILVSLSAENIMQNVVNISSDNDMLKKFIEAWLSKKGTNNDK